MDYDFGDFLNTIKFLDKEDILATANQARKKLERGWNRPNKKDALILADKIQAMALWLETGNKPDNLQTADFMKLRSVCENLIRKTQIPPEYINQFNQIGK